MGAVPGAARCVAFSVWKGVAPGQKEELQGILFGLRTAEMQWQHMQAWASCLLGLETDMFDPNASSSVNVKKSRH